MPLSAKMAMYLFVILLCLRRWILDNMTCRHDCNYVTPVRANLEVCWIKPVAKSTNAKLILSLIIGKLIQAMLALRKCYNENYL